MHELLKICAKARHAGPRRAAAKPGARPTPRAARSTDRRSTRGAPASRFASAATRNSVADRRAPRDRIDEADAVQRAGHRLRRAERQQRADADADRRDAQALLHHQPDHRRGCAPSAMRMPISRVRRADRVGDHAVEPDRRQHHRDDADRADADRAGLAPAAASPPPARPSSGCRGRGRSARAPSSSRRIAVEQRAGVAARARDDLLAGVRPLRHRVVNVRRRAFADRADLVVGRHADDLELRTVVASCTRKRLPIAFWFGQYLRAIASLTIATPGDVGVSAAAKLRPCRIGTPSVAKYSGETRATSITHALVVRPVPIGQEDGVAVVVDRERQPLGERRRLDARNRAHALERAFVELLRARRRRSRSCSSRSRRSRGPPVRKPMSTCCAAIRLRVSSPAATSSTIVTAICVTTRPSRSVQRRPPACVAVDVALQLVHQVRPRRFQRRRKAGDQRRDHRDAGGEEQHARVDAQRERQRNRNRQLDRHREPRQHPRERDAGGRAERRPSRRSPTAAAGRAARGSRRSRGGCRFPSAVPTRARAACSRRSRTRSPARGRRRASARARSAAACDRRPDGCERPWSGRC